MESVIGDYILEDSRSRSGRHRRSSTIMIYSRDKGVVTYSKAGEYIVEQSDYKPTYCRGWAKRVKVKVGKGDYVVYAVFTRNFLGRVKGYISAYNHRGELIYRAKYVDGVLRRSVGNPVNAWLIRLFIDVYRIPVKETHLGDENV